jgi:lipoprotein-anchoring transpeptidase ErfK/SrfK
MMNNNLHSAVTQADSLNIMNQNRPAYHIVIKKTDFSLNLYQDTTLVKVYPCAVGKNPGDKEKQWDYRTPEGSFYIQSIEESANWQHDFPGDGKGPIKGCYGPWFYRLYTGADSTKSGLAWTGYAIHGTHDPDSIGKNASEGCVRLNNSDILDLKQYIQVGTPVFITE